MSKKFEVRLKYEYKVVVTVDADTEYDALNKAREFVNDAIDLAHDDSLVDDVTMPEEVFGYAY